MLAIGSKYYQAQDDVTRAQLRSGTKAIIGFDGMVLRVSYDGVRGHWEGLAIDLAEEVATIKTAWEFDMAVIKMLSRFER
jgi:hypothetical protein